MGFDGFLVPFEAHSWNVRYLQVSVPDLIWSQENWIGPVLPFKPVGRLRDLHHMSGDLGVKVGRNGYARRTGDRSRAHPAGHTAAMSSDTHSRPSRSLSA